MFKKGNIPWNKGLLGIKKPTGGSFKPGHKLWLGKQHTDTTKAKMSTNHADFSGSKHPKWKGGKPRCPDCSKELWYGQVHCLEHRFKNKQPTSIEKIVYELLTEKGIFFEKQKLINKRFLVDAYIPDKNLIIECDGDYWHNRADIKIKDLRKNAYLKKCGFALIRLTEYEINNRDFSKLGRLF